MIEGLVAGLVILAAAEWVLDARQRHQLAKEYKQDKARRAQQ